MKNLNILYPTDFSELSLKHLKELIPLLAPGQNKLLLLHAASRKRKSVMSDKVEVKELFEKFTANCPELEQIDYEFKWDFGISKDLIIRESDNVEIDLIIMPTQGAKGLNRLWGSKTEAVVRDAIVPVMVLPEDAHFKGFKKIILAADFNEVSCDCRLAPLLQLSDYQTSQVDILTVNRSRDDFSRREKMNRKMLKHRLHQLRPSFSEYTDKDVGMGLINYAKKTKADIISIVPRDYNFLEGLFRESVSRKMVLNSPIPLLILK